MSGGEARLFQETTRAYHLLVGHSGAEAVYLRAAKKNTIERKVAAAQSPTFLGKPYQRKQSRDTNPRRDPTFSCFPHPATSHSEAGAKNMFGEIIACLHAARVQEQRNCANLSDLIRSAFCSCVVVGEPEALTEQAGVTKKPALMNQVNGLAIVDQLYACIQIRFQHFTNCLQSGVRGGASPPLESVIWSARACPICRCKAPRRRNCS